VTEGRRGTTSVNHGADPYEIDRKIISMYVHSTTTREIQSHIEEIYGVAASPSLISAITQALIYEVAAWQSRPLELCYPIVFMDAIRVKNPSEGAVSNKAVELAPVSTGHLGITMEA
jgi:Transposase and inactivated derivatives